MSALMWNSASRPLPRCSPVTSGVPSTREAQLFAASARIRFGEHLPVDGHVVRHRKRRERPVRGEGSEMLRVFPGHAATEAAAAVPQFYGHQIVVCLRQARPREPHQHAAMFDPIVDPMAQFRRQRADVGHHDHWQLLIQKLGDDLLRGSLVAEPDIGERR